jgi:hypothetical protein
MLLWIIVLGSQEARRPFGNSDCTKLRVEIGLGWLCMYNHAGCVSEVGVWAYHRKSGGAPAGARGCSITVRVWHT